MRLYERHKNGAVIDIKDKKQSGLVVATVLEWRKYNDSLENKPKVTGFSREDT